MNETIEIIEQLDELRDEETSLHRQLAECMTKQTRLTRELVVLLNEQKNYGLITKVKPYFPKR